MTDHLKLTRSTDKLTSNPKQCSPMTLMDKIRGWEDEKKRIGSKFAECMWTYTKEALTRGRILDKEQEEYLKKRKMSIFSLHNLGLCWCFR